MNWQNWVINIYIPIPINKSQFNKLILIAASNPDVKKAVLDNYWENKWWPLTVKDWRLRMLFAGLSTRVSYRGIHNYQNVRNQLNNIGFHKLSIITRESFLSIVKPLGMGNTRWSYWESIKNFQSNFPDSEYEPENLKNLSNDELIKLIKTQVHGARYKVAQCCVLYMRGYHCGVIPIDSGLRDMLGPCLGFEVNKTPLGNEIMRKHVEKLSHSIDYKNTLKIADYEEIANNWNSDKPNTWWIHLVLIYYKRRFCNLKDSSQCVIRNN